MKGSKGMMIFLAGLVLLMGFVILFFLSAIPALSGITFITNLAKVGIIPVLGITLIVYELTKNPMVTGLSLIIMSLLVVMSGGVLW